MQFLHQSSVIVWPLNRKQLLGSADQSDPVGRVVAQLTTFQEGLGSIQSTLEQKLSSGRSKELSIDLNPLVAQLGSIGEKISSSMAPSADGEAKKSKQHLSLELTNKISSEFDSVKKEILELKNDFDERIFYPSPVPLHRLCDL